MKTLKILFSNSLPLKQWTEADILFIVLDASERDNSAGCKHFDLAAKKQRHCGVSKTNGIL